MVRTIEKNKLSSISKKVGGGSPGGCSNMGPGSPAASYSAYIVTLLLKYNITLVELGKILDICADMAQWPPEVRDYLASLVKPSRKKK